MAGRSQTEVSSGPSLVRVSLVTHTSPVGTLRPRVGTEWAILVQSSKKGTSCTPVLSPSPSFLSVTLQEQLGPPSVSPAWEAGAPGEAGAEGSISAGKHPWRWDRRAFSALWQRPCLAGQRGSVTLSAPTGPGWSSPSRPLGATRAACPRAQGAKMAVKVTPPLPPTLGLTPAKDTQLLGPGRHGVRGPGHGRGGREGLIVSSCDSDLCPKSLPGARPSRHPFSLGHPLGKTPSQTRGLLWTQDPLV